MPDRKPPKYEPVAKTTMTLTMIHPVDLNPVDMTTEGVAYHLNDGEFLGARTSCETTPLNDEDVEGEIEKLGGNTDCFLLTPEVDLETARR